MLSTSPQRQGFALLLLGCGLTLLSFSFGLPAWLVALTPAALGIAALLLLNRAEPPPATPPIRTEPPPEAPAHPGKLRYRGLTLRSKSEKRIAEALDRAEVLFIPSSKARFTLRRKHRDNRELDFVVCHAGAWGLLEVDGPHHERTPNYDRQRDDALRAHGVALIFRVASARCQAEPDAVVADFLQALHELEQM